MVVQSRRQEGDVFAFVGWRNGIELNSKRAVLFCKSPSRS